MDLSANKTKLMTNNGNAIQIDITANGEKLETVKKFKYLGAIVSDEGSITRANEIFMKDWPVLRGLVLVTDAMQAMGLPPGIYPFGEQSVEIKNNKATLKGTDVLAGSIATLDHCVRHFAKQTGCGPVLALQAASLHPAQMLGIDDRKGSLDFGTDADFIMLDDNLNVKASYIAGECVFSSS